LKLLASETNENSIYYLNENIQAIELKTNTFYPALNYYISNLIVKLNKTKE
jgi:hypothetical protein